jgi:hypothetical protein
MGESLYLIKMRHSPNSINHSALALEYPGQYGAVKLQINQKSKEQKMESIEKRDQIVSLLLSVAEKIQNEDREEAFYEVSILIEKLQEIERGLQEPVYP